MTHNTMLMKTHRCKHAWASTVQRSRCQAEDSACICVSVDMTHVITSYTTPERKTKTLDGAKSSTTVGMYKNMRLLSARVNIKIVALLSTSLQIHGRRVKAMTARISFTRPADENPKGSVFPQACLYTSEQLVLKSYSENAVLDYPNCIHQGGFKALLEANLKIAASKGGRSQPNCVRNAM